MALALYRKYRPATFAEVVGQEHVTEPLRIALDGRPDQPRVPVLRARAAAARRRSARILARSLNCEKGPTPDPCGVCDSCIALAPEGPGNIDVVELDAASHGGVDDARELRDRAFYAPAESRYRVFIIDEAHMVTTQGFNALLKIVEEPPEHLVFIFATTEPDKVLPTIRSRTHHYPFRLIPPGTMRALLERICAEEGATVAPAVFPLVIRAGGGSARDTQSVLDQLLAGAGPEGVTYERAVALLGVTDVALIDDMVDGLAAGDRAAVFGAVDRLVEAGHDPRRFASDLLDRLRDLMLLQAVPDAAARGLVDAPGDEVERMTEQAGAARPGDADPLRRDRAHRPDRDARGHRAAAAAGAAVRADAAAGRPTASEPGVAGTAGTDRTPRVDRAGAGAAGETAAAPPPEPGDTQSAAARRTFTRRRAAAGSPDAGTGRRSRPAPPPGTPRSPCRRRTLRRLTAACAGAAGVRTEAARPSPRAVAAEPVDGAAPRPRRSRTAGARPGRRRTGAAAPRRRAAPVVRDRPRRGAARRRPPPRRSSPSTCAAAAPASFDAAAVRRVWSEMLAAAKQRSRSTGALLVNATVRAVEGDTIVLAIGTAPLARRLSEKRNTDVIADALHAVLGVRWRVRCEHGDAAAAARRGPRHRAAPASRLSARRARPRRRRPDPPRRAGRRRAAAPGAPGRRRPAGRRGGDDGRGRRRRRGSGGPPRPRGGRDRAAQRPARRDAIDRR